MMMDTDAGRTPAGPGSIAFGDEAATRLRPSGDDPLRFDGLADAWWDHLHWLSVFEDKLGELIGDFESLGTDDYDASLEINGAAEELRLCEEAQRAIASAGFAKVYLNTSGNRNNRAETHYSFSPGCSFPVRGWRRRYVSDPDAATTNVIAGPANNGYYEISYWPKGWGSMEEDKHGWIASGYMRVIPDPLDPFRDSDTHPKGGDASGSGSAE